MNTDPQYTKDLLQLLLKYGFTDAAFSIMHPDHGSGGGQIDAHLKHCNNVSSFPNDSPNARVQRRLEIILKAFLGGGFSVGNEAIFISLAKASVAQIPF